MRWALLFVLTLAGVSCREPARPDMVATAPPSTPTPTPAPTPAPAPVSAAPGEGTSAPAPAASPSGLDVPAEPTRKQTLAVVGKDDNVVIEVDAAQRRSVVARVHFHRDVVWEHLLPEVSAVEAAVIVDVPRGRVYVAHYSVIDSGATVHGLDLATGNERWATPVKGLGPVSHSKYFNHVTLRLDPGLVVVSGDEAQGRYLEAFDPETGKMRWSRLLPPAKP